MRACLLPVVFAAIAGGAPAPAPASIYTWIDAKGLLNVSNLPPPDGVRVIRETAEPPRDLAREAAARETARQHELAQLQDQLAQLQQDLEQTRREAPPAASVSQTVIVYPPSAPAQYAEPGGWADAGYANVAPGCDYGFNCGFWYGPGAYPVVFVAGGPAFRQRWHPRAAPRREAPPFARFPGLRSPMLGAPALARR